RGQAARRDGAAAAESLEAGVFNLSRYWIYLYLDLHDVAALGGADDARAHGGIIAVKAPDVTRVVVMVQHFITVGHAIFSSLRTLSNLQENPRDAGRGLGQGNRVNASPTARSSGPPPAEPSRTGGSSPAGG